jgi:hypothetical protein
VKGTLSGRPPAGDAEVRLVEEGLLPGVDFCPHALQLNGLGRVPSAEHLLGCQVCLRRWRIVEAGLQGWEPMPHPQAVRTVDAMAAAFASPERKEDFRPFYAHLARCEVCERRLAELTFDAHLSPSS